MPEPTQGEWTSAAVTETLQILSVRASLEDLVRRRATMEGVDDDKEYCVGWICAPAAGLTIAFAENSRVGHVILADAGHGIEGTRPLQSHLDINIPTPTSSIRIRRGVGTISYEHFQCRFVLLLRKPRCRPLHADTGQKPYTPNPHSCTQTPEP